MTDMMSTLSKVKDQISTHDCPKCRGPAFCAMEAGKSSNLCWCMNKPKSYQPDTSFEQCLCKTCLANVTKGN